MAWRLSDVPRAFKEAIAWFRRKTPMTKAEWRTLDQRARQKAFTVAGVAQLDLVAEVHGAIAKAVDEGTTFKDFKAQVGAKLEAEWGRPDSNRLDVIFRTNVQAAYGAGRYEQMSDPDVLAARPYWMYDAVLDRRTTRLCRGLNGTVLAADDAFWDSHTPPLHFRCRSGLRSLTDEQAQARGLAASPPEGHEPADGFGLAPDKAQFKPKADDYPQELWEVYHRHMEGDRR